MQLILITRAGRNFLSIKLTGWRLFVLFLLLSGLALSAIWIGIAFGSYQGSLSERVLHIWQVSRSDSVAKEIGQLKAKIELLELSMRMVQDGNNHLHDLPSNKRLAPDDNTKADLLNDLQVRAQKMSTAVDTYSKNLQLALANHKNSRLLVPVDNAPITSSFGWRQDPLTQERAFHAGIDWSSPVGTPIYAMGNGVVQFIGPASDLGNMVEVRHGAHLVARYAHLQGIEVTTGMPIVAGQRIARVGSTGRSTGAHLHLELLVDGSRVDPEPFLVRSTTRTSTNNQASICCALTNIL